MSNDKKSPKIRGDRPCGWKKGRSRVAKVPLKKSITKVAIPAFLPKIRKYWLFQYFQNHALADLFEKEDLSDPKTRRN